MTRLCLLPLLVALSVFPAPAQTGVTAVLPNGREIHPTGNWIAVAPYPFALALRPDGAQIAAPSIGFPFALNVIDALASPEPHVTRLPGGEDNDPEIETHAGLAYSPDGSLLYLATGDSGKIRSYHTADWTRAGVVSLDGALGGVEYKESFAANLVLTRDGSTLYALDQGNWRIVVIDARSMKRIASIPTGAYPFGLALSPDESRLYVTNTGLFEYTTTPGANADHPLETGLHFPPFGYPSKAAREGVVVEGRKVPGLGDENSLRGSSLWTYDVHDPAHPTVAAKLRLGTRITEARGQTVGGAAPTGIAAAADAVFVSLSHEDAVAKVSPDGSKLLGQVALTPFSGPHFQDAFGHPLRGVMPSGIAVHEGRVYVAESGIDAVGILDAATLQVVAHIPVGWNPSAVAFSPDGQTLYVVNTKGKGSGPNAGQAHDPKTPTYVGSLEYGSISAIRLADLAAPAELTRTVVASNSALLINRPQLPRLKHCFLVIRENRTYDEVLGDVAGANGDASLARYGLDGWAAEDKNVNHLKVTPNLHALAARFAMSDNFYVDSDVSADGHRWVVGINPTPFFNTAWSSNYGGRRHDFAGASQPGRRALFGGADAPMPEDEPQFGSIWEHIAASGKGVLNYGEGLELEGNAEVPGSQPEGQRLFLNSPLPRPVFEATDRHFPTFNLGIPDQYRFVEFKRDLLRRIAAGTVPALIVIRLPGDHTSEPRPGDGYPYRASFVADNDLALGRIVAFLSTTSLWKDSALFVTEDDAQGGVDHVDAHRSLLMVASPWVKPGSVSHEHTSMGSITRTMNELLGLAPLNLEDALAGEITGVFDTAPHLAPFVYQPSDTKVFDPAKAKFAKPKTKEEAAQLHDIDDPDEIREELERSAGRLHRTKDND
ncbi:MAG: bifunctional YncE family protein/alkaline phosphatase family protein [Terracidiphilus sp.]|nr:bifunctional YncE family protein/alkaline phosphatase family protein [Terracidiphilus sp.]